MADNSVERVSGDSRRWCENNINEPDLLIKSTLESCQMQEYLDVVIKHTKNNKNIFLKLIKDDLKQMGISNEEHCNAIVEFINLCRPKKKVQCEEKLSESEAVQIIKNFNEDLKNMNIGLELFMDDLVSNKLENFFVSQHATKTSLHDALEFVHSAKLVQISLATYLYEKKILTNKEFNAISSALNNSYSSKLRKKKIQRAVSWSVFVASIVLASWFYYAQ